MELSVLGQQASGCSNTSCGSTAAQTSALPEAVRAKVHNHPCYSEEAHHYYARMHVAVAPACNIQCNYCNRKYDCANESRPGVVSELLTPEQALAKVLAVGAHVPQMSVLGVAGPGDPLANPERTFATFRYIATHAPDIKLCLSTNGLTLPEHVEEIVALKVDHVTITINCVDPEVGAKIYPWIFWKHQRVRGRKAAEILIRQQQKGLEMLVERGVLVKVNSVMIPGVNDAHLQEVSRTVKAKGAFLHNVMPLISAPEHGTFFGLTGQRGPTPLELQALQDACGGDMNMMRHCRQCRADAVGLLGEDRGQEFTMDKVVTMEIDAVAAQAKRAAIASAIEAHRAASATPVEMDVPVATRPILVAVTSSGGGVINQHFGHAKEFLVYEASPAGVRFLGPRKVDAYCTGSASCDEEEDKMDLALRVLEGCEAVLSAKIGFAPWEKLEAAGITPNGAHAWEPIEAAVQEVYQDMALSGKLAPVPLRVGA